MKKKTFKSLITKEMFFNPYMYEEFIQFNYYEKKDGQTYVLKPIYLKNSDKKPIFKFKKHFYKDGDSTKNKNCYGTINQPCKYCDKKYELLYTEPIEYCIFPVYVLKSPKKNDVYKIKFVELPYKDEMLYLDKYFDENFCLNITVSKNINSKIKFNFRQEYFKFSDILTKNLQNNLIEYNYIFNFLFNKKRFIIENYDIISQIDSENQKDNQKKATIIENDINENIKHIISFKNIKYKEKENNDEWIL